MACNWRSVENLRTSGERLWPAAKVLELNGIPICNEPTSVLVGFHNRPEVDVTEVRDWLRENCQGDYKIFHRFRYEIFPYQTKREYLGVNHRFEKEVDAFYFKFRWY